MSPFMRRTFPSAPDLGARSQFRVVFEDGRTLTLWAEDSVAALADAQTQGVVRTITGAGR